MLFWLRLLLVMTVYTHIFTDFDISNRIYQIQHLTLHLSMFNALGSINVLYVCLCMCMDLFLDIERSSDQTIHHRNVEKLATIFSPIQIQCTNYTPSQLFERENILLFACVFDWNCYCQTENVETYVFMCELSM